MKIVLRADVQNLGNKGDLVEVAPGYARNYLVPRGLAIRASKGTEAQASSMRRSRDTKDAAARAAAEDVATKLVSSQVVINHRAGSEGKLFGSVTTTEIADAIEAQTGVVVDRKQLHLDEPIREVGTHIVPAKLHADVEFPVTLEIAKQ